MDFSCVVDRHPDPDGHKENDADPHADPTPSFYNYNIFFFIHIIASLQCFIFLASSNVP